MKRILIVSPHFPPTDAVDMHRVRMNVAHYPQHGWQPTVLCVRPQDAGRLIDERLCATLPGDLEVHRVGALSERITKPLGVSAIGMRAHRYLARAGDALMKENKFDLVFFSTTAFPVMTLGPRWRKRFGVPFVLDFQDPWYTSPETTPHRTGFKNRAMRAHHRRLEAKTVPGASGLIAVSSDYIEALQSAYPALSSVPNKTIPFGFSAKDFERTPQKSALTPETSKPTPLNCVCAGRINPAMTASLDTLFNLVSRAKALEQDNSTLKQLSFSFLGTGYQPSDNPDVAKPIAHKHGLENVVSEHADRLPFPDAQRALQDADILLILGSDDPAYQPSKLFPYLHLEKPLICVAPSASRLAKQVRDLDGAMFVPTDEPVTDDTARNFASQLTSLIQNSPVADNAARRAFTQRFEASTLAKQECELFDEAVDSFDG